MKYIIEYDSHMDPSFPIDRYYVKKNGHILYDINDNAVRIDFIKSKSGGKIYFYGFNDYFHIYPYFWLPEDEQDEFETIQNSKELRQRKVEQRKEEELYIYGIIDLLITCYPEYELVYDDDTKAYVFYKENKEASK